MSASADMLTAYYPRVCDSCALFENLKIAQDPSFEEYLNKYDVLHIVGVMKSPVNSRTIY